MKKIMLIAIAMLFVLSLAACGSAKDAVQDAVKDAIGGGAGNSSPATSGSSDSGLSQKDIDDANEAWSRLEDLFYAEDWYWDDDWGYINGKWDEGVMYDPVPSPPDGVQVTEMQYIGKKSQKWSEYGTIGDMNIDGTDYEQITVDFDCSETQLDAMVKSFTNAGWMTRFEEDYGNGEMWHFYYGKDYYAYLRASDFAAADGYDFSAYLNVTPAYYELPGSVAGVKLPQYGILMNTGWLDGYDKDYNRIEDELSVDTPVGSLPAYWIFSCEDYCGVTVDDIKAYRDQMAADGWELSYEDESGESYYITLVKGDLQIRCAIHGGYYMDIQISNDDNLYY